MFRHCMQFVTCLTLLAGLAGCGSMSGHSKNNNGIGYFEQGKYSAAAEEFRRAVADSPNNSDYISNYATAMKKQGDLEKAENSYLRALDLDPAHQPSYHGLATLYVETGRTDLAHNLMKSWVDTQPYNPSAHVEMAWMHREMGNLSAAEEELRAALRINPNHPVALAQLGQVYQDSGRPREALSMYQSSLVGDWYQPELQHRVATLTPQPAQPYAAPQYVRTPHPQMVQGPAQIVQGPMLAAPMVLEPTPDFAADPAHVPEFSPGIPEVPAY